MLSVTTIVTIALVCLIAASIIAQALRKEHGEGDGDALAKDSEHGDSAPGDDGIAILREFGIQSDKHSPGSDVSATRQIIDVVMSAGDQRRK